MTRPRQNAAAVVAEQPSAACLFDLMEAALAMAVAGVRCSNRRKPPYEVRCATCVEACTHRMGMQDAIKCEVIAAVTRIVA